MKRFYADKFNEMLEDYYFNLENNPQSREFHHSVLVSGIQHLCGIAFCCDDNETTEALRPFATALMNGEVPRPVCCEVNA